MAKREANEELQKRLAERLRTAQSTGVAASWLAVEAGGRRFLFPLTHAGEIFNVTAPHAVPYTRPWFLGVASLRGGVYGVVDFATFVCGTPPRSKIVSGRDGARLIALNALFDVNCVLLVDRLSGLRGMDGFSASSAAASGDPLYFGHRYVDLDGQTWQEINLQQLAQQADFLAIGS